MELTYAPDFNYVDGDIERVRPPLAPLIGFIRQDTAIYRDIQHTKGVCFMFLNPHTQRTILKTNVDDYLETWMKAFLMDRKAKGVAKGTMMFYS